jgi:hypothetical protein
MIFHDLFGVYRKKSVSGLEVNTEVLCISELKGTLTSMTDNTTVSARSRHAGQDTGR